MPNINMGKNLETIPSCHITHLPICLFFPHFPQKVEAWTGENEKALFHIELIICNISVISAIPSVNPKTPHALFYNNVPHLMEIPDGPVDTRVSDCRFRSEIVSWLMSLLGRSSLSFFCGSVSPTAPVLKICQCRCSRGSAQALSGL